MLNRFTYIYILHVKQWSVSQQKIEQDWRQQNLVCRPCSILKFEQILINTFSEVFKCKYFDFGKVSDNCKHFQ